MFEFEQIDNLSVLDIIKDGKLRLVSDLVLIEPIDDKKVGMFEVPSKQTRMDTETQSCYGKVLKVGPGDFNKKGVFIPTSVQPGMHLLLKRSHMMRQKINNEIYYLTREKEILAVLDEEDCADIF